MVSVHRTKPLPTPLALKCLLTGTSPNVLTTPENRPISTPRDNLVHISMFPLTLKCCTSFVMTTATKTWTAHLELQSRVSIWLVARNIELKLQEISTKYVSFISVKPRPFSHSIPNSTFQLCLMFSASILCMISMSCTSLQDEVLSMDFSMRRSSHEFNTVFSLSFLWFHSFRVVFCRFPVSSV